MDVRDLLREYVGLLIERGTLLDVAEDELEAKQAYQHALDAFEAWKRDNPEGASTAALKKREKELLKAIDKAQQELSVFDPDVENPQLKPTGKPEPGPTPPPADKQEHIKIDDVVPLRLYLWAQFADVIGDVPYRGTQKGSHPAEEWLAAILGAQLQGDLTKFDLVTKDGRKWEVKDAQDGMLRPGRLGRDAFNVAYERMLALTRQLRNFKNFIQRHDVLDLVDNDDDLRRFVVISTYLYENLEKVTGGEISRGTIYDFRKSLLAAARLKQTWTQRRGKKSPQTVSISGKTREVPYNKYVTLAIKANKIDPNISLDDIGVRDQAAARLVDGVFDDPDRVNAWIKNWVRSINVERVFPEAGVFVVKEKTGFYMIPRDLLATSLQFVRTSKFEPRFRVQHGDAEQVLNDVLD